MNLQRLHEILDATTFMLRKGQVIEGDEELVKAVTRRKPGDDPNLLPGGTVHEFSMPHESEAPRDGVEKVDVHFIVIGVNKKAADPIKAELHGIMREYPRPERLYIGESYISLAGVIGDQDATLRLFGLGHYLGLWSVITPKDLGYTGAEADELAGRGYVAISGYKRELAA